MGTEVGSVYISLGLDLSNLRKGLEEATSQVGSIGRKMESVGRNLTLGLSAPIAAAGGAAVKAAGDFEESFSKIEGLVGV
jgi:phage-related minor tail protein